jgi:hypothetical protein
MWSISAHRAFVWWAKGEALTCSALPPFLEPTETNRKNLFTLWTLAPFVVHDTGYPIRYAILNCRPTEDLDRPPKALREQP